MMYDQSFTKINIKAMLKHSDFFRNKELEQQKDLIIENAYNAALFSYKLKPNIVTTTVNKKKKTKNIYSFKNFSDKILSRKICRNLKVYTKTKQSNRNTIVYNLRKLLEENVKYRVYRRDIRDFYGSVAPSIAIQQIEDNWKISGHTVNLIKNLLSFFKDNEKGLPRGLQISAVLAEAIMLDFDKAVKNHSHVFFYARFVDDIIILTDGDETVADFEQFLKTNLPKDTLFNTDKSKLHTKLLQKISSLGALPILVDEFDFLGYNFKIYDPIKSGLKTKETPRIIHLEMSEAKVRKAKTRIIKAFLAYLKHKDFDLLYDAIKMLTGNYYIFDRDYHVKRMAGVYFSYKQSQGSDEALIKLDKFLQNIILSGKGKFSSKLKTGLTRRQKGKLLGQTYKNGFNNKVIHHFNVDRMIEITKCWSHD